jgi:hypothetical protein
MGGEWGMEAWLDETEGRSGIQWGVATWLRKSSDNLHMGFQDPPPRNNEPWRRQPQYLQTRWKPSKFEAAYSRKPK